MFAPKPRIEIATRILLIAVVLFNAFAPVTAYAGSQSRAHQSSIAGIESESPRSLVEPKPLYYDPPQTIQTQKRSPEGDKPVSPIPPMDAVEFTLVADPAVVPTDGLVQFNAYIRNNTEREIVGLTFADPLETGLEYRPSTASPVTYDSENSQVVLVIDSLLPGEEASFTYTLLVTATKRNQTRGKIWLHGAELNSVGSNIHIKTTAAFGVDLTATTGLAALPLTGGWNDLGRIAVHMEKENVGRNAAILASPTKVNGKGPALQFKLDVYETSPLTTDALGKLNEQTVSLNKEYKGAFKASAFLEINLDDFMDLKNIPAGQEPYVATYDETRAIWVKVPILEIDHEKNSVTVEAAHFSTWGAGLGSSLPQNGANVLLFDQPYTSLFTGSSRYSIPIWTPPGRAGMQPEVSLSYSSGTVDGVLGDVQAPWVGVGWNIDAVEIVRKITTDDNGYGYRNEFALTLNGSLYQLVRDENHQNRYYTDQAAFLYVERHTYAWDNKPSTANTTGEWWEVVTTDGTRYRLGWNNRSEQLALMYGYSCTTNGLSCITPNGAYASLGYAGKATDLVAMRWRVDRVTDTHGNYIEYQYEETSPSTSTTIAAFDRESYLDSILYTGFQDPKGQASPLAPGYKVKFTYDDRSSVGDVPVEFNIWDNIDSKLLKKIELFCVACTITPAQKPIRTYEFGYNLATSPNANGTLTLTSLIVSGGGYTENGQTIPATTAPTIRFSYQDMPNRATGNGDVFNYPRLTTIQNGSGGQLTFNYETDNRANNSWYNYRVQNVVVDSGIGTAKKQSYTYGTPVYSGSSSLIGYPTVTESVLNFNNGDAKILDIKHTFGTVGLDIGRELQTEQLIGGTTTVLQKSTNVYVTDNSEAPFTGWNYRYLGETSNYVRSGSSLVLTSRSTYYNDPATGNPLVQSTYNGNSLYRKTYYQYMTNPDPAHYILDKVSRVLLVSAANQIYSDVRYHYDGTMNQAPTRGDVTLTQALTGNAGTSNQTVDATTSYDIYGNVIASQRYKGYGTVDTYPVSAYVESRSTLDPVFRTFPIVVTDPLQNSSTTEYIFTLGVPYQVTDPNQWTSQTTYDGLGRTLSVTPPGLNQAGTVYRYPSPNAAGTISAPHSVEMQILDTIAGKYRSVWGIYDGAGRMIQTQVDAGNQLLVNTTLFNAQGLAYQQSLPYSVAGAGGNYTYTSGNQFTATEYDALGRVTKVTAPGNIISQTIYDGLTTNSLDPKGNKASRTSDGLGRMVSVNEYSDVNTVYATTQYFYDPADRLLQVKDAQANTTNIQYNWLGQKTGMDDPDMGVWTYGYDSLGNLSSQIDAREEQLTFVYDDLNRLIQKMDEDALTPDITYSYGTAIGVIGLRTGMSDASGSASWTYSNFGRTVSESRTIGGATKTITTNADWLGRSINTSYDDGEVITYQYDELGRPDQLQSDQTTLVDVAYNTLGQIATQVLGNGTLITNTYDFNTANNDGTTRLTSRKAEKNATVLMELTYAYDSNGNITQLTDNTLSETHFYQYDALNRLTSAVAGTGILINPPATPQLYGQKFEYDKVGNMLQMNNWGAPPTQLAHEQQGETELAGQAPDVGNPDIQSQSGLVYPVAYHNPAPAYQVTLTETPTPTGSFPSTAILDDFNRAENPLSTNWEAPLAGSLQANGSTGQGGSAQNASIYATQFSGDAEVFATISTKPASGQVVLLGLRSKETGSLATIDGYDLMITAQSGTDTWAIRRVDNGVATVLASGTQEYVSNDQFRLSIIGTTLTAYHNGTALGGVADATYPSPGKLSLAIIGTSARVDNLGGGNVSAGPTPTSTQTPTLTSTSTSTTTPTASSTTATTSSVTPTIVFPTTAVIDDFNRADGPVSVPWYGRPTDFSISFEQLSVNQLSVNSNSTMLVWKGATFGANSEAFVTFSNINTVGASEHALILKGHGNGNPTDSRVEVSYFGAEHRIVVRTCTSGLWAQHGEDISVTFSNGDQFGARAQADGTVEVYKNGAIIATRSITGWQYSAQGGYHGIGFYRAVGAIVDDFGGGNLSMTGTTTATSTRTSTSTLTPTSTSTSTATSTATATHTPTKTPIPVNTSPGTSTPSAIPILEDSSTVSLLHFNGVDGSTTFRDELGKTWTAAGNGQIDTAQFKFNGSSGLFDGSGDYLSSPDNAAWNLGTGDFTIEFWTRFNSVTASQAFFSQDVDGNNRFQFYIDIPNHFLDFYVASGGSQVARVGGSFSPSTNIWYHIALVRNTTNLYIFVNGVQVASSTIAANTDMRDRAAPFAIGYRPAFSDMYLNGWIDEFRVSKGVARWTSNFTPPSQPYNGAPTATPTASFTPTPTNTGTATPGMPQSLMAYWDFQNVTGTTVPDVAPNDVTANNATLINGASTQTPGAQGSSVLFDGTDDYASVSDNAEIKKNGSFTVSAWVNPASSVTSQTQYVLRKAASANDFDYGFTLNASTSTPPANIDANGKLVFTVGDLTPNKVVGPVLPINTWTLLTGVYDSTAGELRLYLNGTLSAVEKVTGTVSMGAGPLTFSGASPNQFNGSLDEVRFYNRALTTYEVNQLFSTFATPTPLPGIVPTVTSPATFTPTATALPLSAQQWGLGNDGNLTVNGTFNINAHTNGVGGRSCADGAAYSVTSLSSTVASLSTSPTGCLNPNDEIMLIHLQGSENGSSYNAGVYEFLRVASVSGNSVMFTQMKTHWYGDEFHSDANIGTGAGQQRVMLMRVPNYENVTIDGTLTSNTFDGYKYGVIAFRVHGILTGSASGTISASNRGFAGAIGGSTTAWGYSPGGSAPYNNANGVEAASGGGGGYATGGGVGGNTPNAGAGGSVIYGNPPLAQLFLGSGGGAANLDWFRGGCGPGDSTPCWLTRDRAHGGPGGGIVYIAGQTISFSGSVLAAGAPKSSVADSSLHGGAGAGGSIRIEGNTITLGTLSAPGGSSSETYGYGGRGRIAVYYQTSYSALVSIPDVYTGILGQPPTPTPSPTPISLATPSSYGTGKDGNLNVPTTFNINTEKSGTRLCADAASYNVVELLSSSAKLSAAPAAGCLAVGDEIMLAHLWGSGSNIGNYEYLRIGGVIGDTIYFKTPKASFYGANATDDGNIGIGSGQQRVMLMRVPNYENVTVNGTLTSNAFDGYKNGVIAFRVHGTLTGSGSISVSNKGFVGPYQTSSDAYGYSVGCTPPWNNANKVPAASGGGGGHATAGGVGGYETGSGCGGGVIYGNAQLTKLFFGSGGGASNLNWFRDGDDWSSVRTPGGPGGGIVFIAGQTINFTGSLLATGSARPTVSGSPLRGGAGAGGSIRIEGNTIVLGTISAAGGPPMDGYGYGGNGRVAIYYSNSLTNNATICAQASTYCKNTSQVPTPTATVVALTPTNTATPTPMPQGWYPNTYTYSTDIPHAVTSVNRVNFTDEFTYDANGNMTCRKESGINYKQDYSTENRIAAIHKMSGNCSTGTAQESWLFAYDGDGVRVSTAHYTAGFSEPDLITRYYFGGAYETSSDGAWKKYYSFAGQTIAMKDSAGLQYFLTDHLGSIMSSLGSDGTLISQQRYLPFGAVRTDVGSITGTDFGYTSQRKLDSGMGGIMDYKARFYSPYINHFLQPDTIIPDLSNPQSWNRYSYVSNNPTRYNDPDGHCAPACAVPIVLGITAIVGITAAFYIAVTPTAHEYISKRVLDAVDDVERNVSDTNNGRNFPSRGCGSSIKMVVFCLGGVLLIGKAIIDSGEKGGCGEPESNVSCPPSATSTLNPSPTASHALTPSFTPTSTSSPTLTPSLTPTRTPSPTLTPSLAPTSTPTKTLNLTPTARIPAWEKRLLKKNLE